MSDQPIVPPAPEQPPAPEGKAPEQPSQAFTQAEVDRIVAERIARERGKYAGFDDLKAKAEEFDKLTEAQKTEAQRQADATARALREAEDARSEALRYRAAATHGIAPDYFDLLGSGDEAAVTARAERLGGLLKVASENEQLKAELEALRAGRPAPVPGRPTPQLKPGATPEHSLNEDDVLYNSLYPGG